MSRSLRKGPYIQEALEKRILAMKVPRQHDLP